MVSVINNVITMYISVVHLKEHSPCCTPLYYDDAPCCRILVVEVDTSEMQASETLSRLRFKKTLKSMRKTFPSSLFFIHT